MFHEYKCSIMNSYLGRVKKLTKLYNEILASIHSANQIVATIHVHCTMKLVHSRDCETELQLCK